MLSWLAQPPGPQVQATQLQPTLALPTLQNKLQYKKTKGKSLAGVIMRYPRPSTGHQLKSGLGWQWPERWQGLTAKGLQQCVILDGWWALWHHPPSQTLISHPVQCHPKHPGMARQWGAPGLSPLSLISAWPKADAERYVCEVMGEKAE